MGIIEREKHKKGDHTSHTCVSRPRSTASIVTIRRLTCTTGILSEARTQGAKALIRSDGSAPGIQAKQHRNVAVASGVPRVVARVQPVLYTHNCNVWICSQALDAGGQIRYVVEDNRLSAQIHEVRSILPPPALPRPHPGHPSFSQRTAVSTANHSMRKSNSV